ncbi:unnamed protein product [Cunninghamella blakesleeana]
MVQTELLDSLSDCISAHANAFDSLLNLIPVKFYITDSDSVENDSKFMHNKRKKAPKQAIKEASKKAKKAKLDPANQRTVAEIQQEQAEKIALEKQQSKEIDDDSVSNNSDNNNDMMDEDSIGSEPPQMATKFNGLGDDSSKEENTNEDKPVLPMPRSEMSELKRRLHERIIEQRQKRNAPGSSSKARSREAILAERLKKKQDRKKALKAQKEKGNKAAPEELVNDPTKTKNAKKMEDSVKMDGEIIFGKLDIGNQQKKKGAVDAKSQLKKIELQQQKLEKLKTEDKEKAESLMEKQEWQKAVALATGEKIKDDTTLLKKTIKRQEKAKAKSSQEWNKRIEKVKQDEQNKIKKRTDNIQKRIDAKKARKAGKKGGNKKARPGFEGNSKIKGGRISKPNPKAKGKKK